MEMNVERPPGAKAPMEMGIQRSPEAKTLEVLHQTDDSSIAQPLKYYFSWSSRLKALDGGQEIYFATPSPNRLNQA